MEQDLSLNNILKDMDNNFITNLSINSLAGTRFTISRNATPWSQLRQCEQIIFEKISALEDSWFGLREKQRDIVLKTVRLNSLKSFGGNTPEGTIEVQKLEDELLLAERRKERTAFLIRDAMLELKIAYEEKERILEENPGFTQGTFEELQEKYSSDSLQSKIACNLATKMLVMAGLPEEFATTLVEFPAEQWKPIIEKSNAIFVESEKILADASVELKLPANPNSANIDIYS